MDIKQLFTTLKWIINELNMQRAKRAKHTEFMFL
jgi:hypothetical protein